MDVLGDNAIEKIKEKPDILDDIVSSAQKESIVSQLLQEDYFDEAVRLFMVNGLSMKMLLKIRSVYQDDMVHSPFVLAKEFHLLTR